MSRSIQTSVRLYNRNFKLSSQHGTLLNPSATTTAVSPLCASSFSGSSIMFLRISCQSDSTHLRCVYFSVNTASMASAGAYIHRTSCNALLGHRLNKRFSNSHPFQVPVLKCVHFRMTTRYESNSLQGFCPVTIIHVIILYFHSSPQKK